MDTKINFSYKIVMNLDDLNKHDNKLIHSALGALPHAYAPYSNFYVASAVLLKNGEIICGTNQENASYPLCLCAERLAILSAKSRYPGYT